MTKAEHDKDMIESIEMWLHECEPKYVEKELAWLNELRSRLIKEPISEPVSEEEEINRLWESFADEMEGPHNLFDIYARLARHFAQWGAEHLKK